jgi:hypothetical protein
MTPRVAGLVTGVVVFASMAASAGAVTIARHAASADVVVGGGLASFVALRVGALAV